MSAMRRQWKPTERTLPLLALGALGGQSVWSTEMAFAGPYLLHLGMSKSSLASVFIAGPLSGLIVQPIVGVLTDNSTSRWGRRRPALATACVLCAFSVLLLGFARPLVSIFTSIEPSQTNWTIAFVVFSVFAIDFSVNAVGALDRVLILDLVPSKQQSLANVWSARISGLGSILGFFIGQVDLTTSAPFTWLPGIFGSKSQHLDASETQLRCVCVMVVFLLLSTHAVTMAVAKETPAAPDPSRRLQDKQSVWRLMLSSLIEAWTGLITAAKGLSRPVLDVFRIQFFASMAWYPLLFYSTAWVSDIAQSGTVKMDAAAAMRLGSSSMLLHACFSFACTLILPSILQLYNRHHPSRSMDSLTVLWSFAIFTLALVLMSTKLAETLDSTNLAMTSIGLSGFAWCLTVWAPYALLGILLQKGVEGQSPQGASTLAAQAGQYAAVPANGAPIEEAPLMRRSFSGDDEEHDAEEGVAAGDRSELRKADVPLQSGTISGLHNVCLVLPQFLMTAFTSVVFKLLQSEEGGKKRDAANFGLVLRLGGLAAFVTAYYTFRLARQHSAVLEG